MKRLLMLTVMACTIATAFAQNITRAEYFINTDPGPGNGIPVAIASPAGTVNFPVNISTNSLPQGFHIVNVRVRDENGLWSMSDGKGFYITPIIGNTTNIVAAEYFFDLDPGVGNGTPIPVGTPGAIVNFPVMIPTSLSQGFHFLGIRVRDAEGKWSLFDQKGFYITAVTAK